MSLPEKIVHANGCEEWLVNGLLHRLDGPARIFQSGRQEWYEDGLFHRLDGAAYIGADGSEEWWVNGNLHRLDGPAVIWENGHQEWWANGYEITHQVMSWMELRDVTWPWDESTQVEFLLSWRQT